MTTSFVIPTLFRIVNFSIIIGAGVYLYRRYGRALLQDMFEHYEKHKQSLRDELVLLDVQAQKLKEDFVAQHALGLRLAKNIEQWQLSVAHAVALRQQEKEVLKSILQRKAERVARHTVWISLRRESGGLAVKEATELLTAFYAEKAHAQDYIESVLTKLKKRPLNEQSLDKSSPGEHV